MKLTLYSKIIIAVIFAFQAYGKISGENDALYAKWGLEGSKLYALAAVEIIGAAALFTAYGHLAAIGLVGILGGAFFTLIQHQEPSARFFMPALAAGLLLFILYKRYLTIKKEAP